VDVGFLDVGFAGRAGARASAALRKISEVKNFSSGRSDPTHKC